MTRNGAGMKSIKNGGERYDLRISEITKYNPDRHKDQCRSSDNKTG